MVYDRGGGWEDWTPCMIGMECGVRKEEELDLSAAIYVYK